jgi:DNA mismatch repair protein MutS
VHNWHIAVKEEGHDVIFLRKLERGGVAHSFGIHVARMAGMPQEVIQSAERTLRELEMRERNADALSKDTASDGSVQLSLFQLDDPTLSAVREQLLGTDLNNITPLQAFDLLRKLKEEVGADK